MSTCGLNDPSSCTPPGSLKSAPSSIRSSSGFQAGRAEPRPPPDRDADQLVGQRQIARLLVAQIGRDADPEPEPVVDRHAPLDGDRRVRGDRPQRGVRRQVGQPLRLRPGRRPQLVDRVHGRDAGAVPGRVEAFDVRGAAVAEPASVVPTPASGDAAVPRAGGRELAELAVQPPGDVGQEPRRLQPDLARSARRAAGSAPTSRNSIRGAHPDAQEAEQHEPDPGLDDRIAA